VYLTQTTLSLDDTQKVIMMLQEKYPGIQAPPIQDICYATTNRQGAVKALAKEVDLVLIIGSETSSNSKRLAEVARAQGKTAYLLDDVSHLDPLWFEGVKTVGISAGASAPEERVQELANYFSEQGASIQDFNVQPENMKFAEPLELMKLKRERA
ncbi:MAG: 4-hydroxy-3-methylbut-2-enyl diphosphate reductase, partial [Candidatus Moraniibacteriota bacterium]